MIKTMLLDARDIVVTDQCYTPEQKTELINYLTKEIKKRANVRRQIRTILVCGAVDLKGRSVTIDISINGKHIQLETTRQAWRKDFSSLLHKAQKGA